MLNAADGDDRLKHTAERWMRDLEGWSCAVELLWWSQLIRPTDGWLVPWAQRRRNLTGERLTRRCLWQYKCVGLYYTLYTLCAAGCWVCMCVCVCINMLICCYCTLNPSRNQERRCMYQPTRLHLCCLLTSTVWLTSFKQDAEKEGAFVRVRFVICFFDFVSFSSVCFPFIRGPG